MKEKEELKITEQREETLTELHERIPFETENKEEKDAEMPDELEVVTDSAEEDSVKLPDKDQENRAEFTDDADSSAEQRSTSKKKYIKLAGIAAAFAASILILILAFSSSSYEKTIKKICHAMENGNQRKIESLLFDREPMEKDALKELFNDFEYYYGKGYKITCEEIFLIDEVDEEGFKLLDHACEVRCWESLESEISITSETKLSEVVDKYALYEEVMAFGTDAERYAFLANRYGATYPADISHFENCTAYYVKAKIIVSDKRGRNEDESSVYFTIICRDGKYMVDCIDGAGIATEYVGAGYVYTASKKALLPGKFSLFELDRYAAKEAKLSDSCVEELLEVYDMYCQLIDLLS